MREKFPEITQVKTVESGTLPGLSFDWGLLMKMNAPSPSLIPEYHSTLDL